MPGRQHISRRCAHFLPSGYDSPEFCLELDTEPGNLRLCSVVRRVGDSDRRLGVELVELSRLSLSPTLLTTEHNLRFPGSVSQRRQNSGLSYPLGVNERTSSRYVDDQASNDCTYLHPDQFKGNVNMKKKITTT